MYPKRVFLSCRENENQLNSSSSFHSFLTFSFTLIVPDIICHSSRLPVRNPDSELQGKENQKDDDEEHRHQHSCFLVR